MSTSSLESERRSGSMNGRPLEHPRAFVEGLHLQLDEANAAILNARLAAIVESSEDAIISKDLNGRIQTWNAGAERIFGYVSAEIIGNSITLLIPAERRTEEDKILEQIRRGERVPPFETVRLTKDGRRVDVSVTVSPIRDLQGRIVGASKIARNISDRKQAEREIAKAAEMADRAHRAKDDFLAILSHELRTPLTPVLVSVCDLLDDQRLPPDVRETLGMIHRNIELQVKLIDDLLDVTRITRGKLELIRRPLDLARVFLDAVEVCKRALSAKRQELIIERPFGPFPVMGDPTRLEQVFWNLLSNASKFTPEGGRITIRSWASPELPNRCVTIEVSDSGVGIEPEVLTCLFNPFEQGGRSTTRQYGGLGLGLAICKSVVELHGGSIRAESDGKGMGSTFVVRLPLADEVCRQLEKNTGDGPVLPKAARILLVEDHADTVDVLSRLLQAHGLRVEVATSLAAALKAGTAESFDVVVADLTLPDGSGLSLPKQLSEKNKSLRLIALSGNAMPEDIEQSQNAGFAEHLVKPVVLDKLLSAIARVVS